MPRTKKASAVPTLRGSAQNIWLAGLGAFALAGEEGSKLFRTLVKKGQTLEKVNKGRLQKMITRVEGRMEDLREDAGGALSRVTSPLDNGMTTALHRIGVPTRKEIMQLTRRVEELTRTVQRSKARGRRAKTTRRKKAAATA